MTRSEIDKEVAKRTGTTITIARGCIDAFLGQLTQSMCNKGSVTLRGFGTFSGKYQPEREGRNPGTGEKIVIPAKTVPKFKPSQSLKNWVS